MSEKWIVFDLIGVLAEPSWRELVPDPDLERWRSFKVGGEPEETFWESGVADLYRTLLQFRADRMEFVESLRGRGYKICIATNFSTEWYDCLVKQLEDPTIFAASVISSRIGVAKPDEGFWSALRELVPAGSVFIDDRKSNCDAAREAGFRSVWAHPGAQVEQQVEKLLAQDEQPN